MQTDRPRPTKNFRQLEHLLTIVLCIALAMFALFLLGSGNGIIWLKVVAAIAVIVIDALAVGFLVLIQEHKRSRSRWLVVAFAGILLCTLVSLILNYPSAGVSIP